MKLVDKVEGMRIGSGMDGGAYEGLPGSASRGGKYLLRPRVVANFRGYVSQIQISGTARLMQEPPVTTELSL